MYFDENRVINIPNATKPDYFWIECNQHEHVFFIRNIRIAKGAVPLYDRLASDGKIITYAITFDTGKATLKPESTGEINRITKIMQDDPSIVFEVQGHCDNTGTDKVNFIGTLERFIWTTEIWKGASRSMIRPLNLHR